MLRGMAPSSETPVAALPDAPAADNATLAEALREMATLLEAQGDDNRFRIAAYRQAAATVAAWPRSLRVVFQHDGLAGLDALPAVGPGIARALAELLQTGRWQRLERLRGAADPQALFRTLPGVGPQLAQQLHDELGADTLEALEVAALQGRLERLAGIGPRRAAAIRAALAQRLGQRRGGRPRAVPPGGAEPAVELLLDVDREYREAAQAGRLRTIAPRRLNPDQRAWLPVLHTRRGSWAITALFSNTARAHELGKVHDWVVLYAEDPAHEERQYTVVTATSGPLAGQRVVRGREAECLAPQARCA